MNTATKVDIHALLDRVRTRRRAHGLNVRFLNEHGKLDEWSFANRARVATFVRQMHAANRPCWVSAP